MKNFRRYWRLLASERRHWAYEVTTILKLFPLGEAAKSGEDYREYLPKRLLEALQDISDNRGRKKFVNELREDLRVNGDPRSNSFIRDLLDKQDKIATDRRGRNLGRIVKKKRPRQGSNSGIPYSCQGTNSNAHRFAFVDDHRKFEPWNECWGKKEAPPARFELETPGLGMLPGGSDRFCLEHVSRRHVRIDLHIGDDYPHWWSECTSSRRTSHLIFEKWRARPLYCSRVDRSRNSVSKFHSPWWLW